LIQTCRIISANHLAKAKGINNSIKLTRAQEICQNYPGGPKLTVFEHPTHNMGKPDQTLLRAAGRELYKYIRKFTKVFHRQPILEWVPQDECYIDLTDEVNYLYANKIPHKEILAKIGTLYNLLGKPVSNKSKSTGSEWPLPTAEFPEIITNYSEKNVQNEKYLLASTIVKYLQKYIHDTTTFHCSAGIGPSKMMAKIACGLKPPGSLCYLGKAAISKSKISKEVPLKKLSPLKPWVRNILKTNGITTMWDLQRACYQDDLGEMLTSKAEIRNVVKVARGEDTRPVVERSVIKTVNCARNFFSKVATIF